MVPILRLSAFVSLVVIAMACDLKDRKVPNALTVTAAALALAIAALPGEPGFRDALLGFVVGFAVGVPLFALGGLGGGDVKLLAAVGAFLGFARLPMALLVTAFVGGAMAIFIALRNGILLETVFNTLRVAASLVAPKKYERPTLLSPQGSILLPYAVAIGAGALIGWFA